MNNIYLDGRNEIANNINAYAAESKKNGKEYIYIFYIVRY